MKEINSILLGHRYMPILVIFSVYVKDIMKILGFRASRASSSCELIHFHPITAHFFMLFSISDIMIYYNFLFLHLGMLISHIYQLVSAIHSFHPLLI